MANQLRAALYALVRNYRTWVALALVVLGKAYAAWSVTQGVTYGLQDSLFRDKALLLVVLFAGAGVAAFDQRGGALRSACCTERGRTGYVASRFVAVSALALGLLAAAVALDVVVGALAPGASVIAASPAMGAPMRVVAGVLTYLTVAEIGFAAGLVTRGWSAIATAGVVVVAYLALCVIVLIGVVPAGSPTPFGVTLSEAIGFALPLEGLKADVMFTPTALLIPPDPLRAILVPIVWVGALFALARFAMARRTV